MIYFTYADNSDRGVGEISKKIIENVVSGKKVVWLLCGGSTISAEVEVQGLLKKSLSESQLKKVNIALTDERYGNIGHKDSNWQQLIDAGFAFSAESQPVLSGKNLKETVEEYEVFIKKSFEDADLIIGQFGIGADGHIAGALPFSEAATSKNMVCGYTAESFTRITLTPQALKKIHAAYVFAFGASKAPTLNTLKNKELSIEEQPSQILKQISEVKLYSDQRMGKTS